MVSARRPYGAMPRLSPRVFGLASYPMEIVAPSRHGLRAFLIATWLAAALSAVEPSVPVDQYFIAALLSNLKGIRLARLKWAPRS